MIKQFRALNPFNILWLGVFLFALRVGFVIKPPQNTGFALVEPFARLLIPINTETYFTPTVNLFLSGIFVFIQALWLNQIVNQLNLLGKPSFLPALMFIALTALLKPFLLLSAPILCNFLLLWLLTKLINFYKNEGIKAAGFDIGMIVGLGTLIYFPFIYMFLVVWLAFIIFRPFIWREWAAVVVGFVTIFFFLGVLYFWNDRFDDFFKIWLPLANFFPSQFDFNYRNYTPLLPVALIFLLSVFALQKSFFKSYVQVRKSFQLLFGVLIISGLSFYTKTNFQISHFLLCAVPCSVIFSYYFLYARARWFYELLFFTLIFSIIYFQFNTF